MESNEDESISTLVAFHDLLGFGELVAASGGTLDSAVGRVAYSRIEALRSTAYDTQPLFPTGTTVFQFNDSVMALLDVDVDITSAHTDATGIGGQPLARQTCLQILRFLGASAVLHHECIKREEQDRLGPAGRTFVVLGKRWPLRTVDDRMTDVLLLQANLAFAEAYTAEAKGSSVGFGGRTFENLFVNDLLWFCLSILPTSLLPADMALLRAVGVGDKPFPARLQQEDSRRPVEVSIFHRPRKFFSLMSHHAINLVKLSFPEE